MASRSSSLRQLRRGHPALDAVGEAITPRLSASPGARQQARAGAAAARDPWSARPSRDRWAAAAASRCSRWTTGTLALHREGGLAPAGPSTARARQAVRQLLRETFGSGAGDLALLGTARRTGRAPAAGGLAGAPAAPGRDPETGLDVGAAVSDALARAGCPGVRRPGNPGGAGAGLALGPVQ